MPRPPTRPAQPFAPPVGAPARHDGAPASVEGSVTEPSATERSATERSAAERALDAASDLCVRMDAGGRVVYQNAAHARALGRLGVDAASVIGRLAWEAVPALAGTPVEHACRHAMERRVATAWEHAVPPDWRLRGEALPTEDGGILVVAQNVTAQWRAESRLRTAMDRMERLQTATAAFGRALTPADVARVTLTEGLAAIRADAGLVYVQEPDGTLAVTAHEGLAPAVFEPWRRLSRDAAHGVAEAVRDRRAVYLPTRAAAEARYASVLDAPRLGHPEAWVALPLLCDGACLGALALGFGAAPAFDAEDRAFLDAFAAQCAQALDRARRVEAERAARGRAERAAAQLAGLQSVIAKLGAATSLADVADVVTRAGLRVVGATRGSMAIVAPDGESLRVVGSVGYPTALVAQFAEVPLAASFPLTDVVRERAPLLLGTCEERAARFPHLEALRRDNGGGAMAALPLMSRGRAVGALGFNWEAARAFTDDDRAFFDALARQCAQAVERARLHADERAARETARRTAARLQLVVDASRAIGDSALDPLAVTDKLAEVLAREVGDQCVVRLASDDGEWLDVAAVRHRDPALESLVRMTNLVERYRADDGVSGRVYRSGEPTLVSTDAASLRATMKPAFHACAERLGLHSVLCVPLWGRDRVIGTAFMARGGGTPAYAPEDLTLVTEVAHRAALVLERAQLLESERRARAEAEQANQAKSAFLAAMSHELRTPLNGIGGYLELIELGVRGPVTDAQRTDLQRMRRAHQHLLTLIEDILSFARIEAGKLAVRCVPVSVADTLRSLESLVAPQMAAKGIRYVAELPDDTVTVSADRARLEQIGLNLLSNAIKATEAGGSVAVSCAVDGDEVRVRVADTGIGIPTDQLETIFAPFTQLGRSLSSPQSGTGLGLSISRGLAEAMGGRLTAESRLGEGAAFTLTLMRG